jgi:hypothetical protein
MAVAPLRKMMPPASSGLFDRLAQRYAAASAEEQQMSR